MTDTVCVPVEPTEAMIAAGKRAAWDDDNSMPAISAMRKAWSAMLAASPQGEGSSADAPVEAVAWRFWHEGGWNFSLADPSPHLADCVERDALYTYPAPIKPSVDTGELRKRVAKIVDPAGFDDRWDVPGLRHEASLDERVDEALAKADAILDLIQSERAG